MTYPTWQPSGKWGRLPNKVLVLGLAWLLPWMLSAQTEKPERDIPRITLKTNATVLLLTAKQSWQISSDIRLKPNWSVDVGGGTFIGSTLFARYQDETYQGLRLRLGGKWHFDPTKERSGHLGIELKYHNIQNLNYRTLLRQGGQYTETSLINRRIKTLGAAIRYGIQWHTGLKNRFLIELFMGAGVVRHKVTRPLPPDAEVFERESFFPSFTFSPGIHWRPDVFFGMNFGVAIW